MGTYEAIITDEFVATHAVNLPDGLVEDPHEHSWCVTAAFRAGKLTEPMGVVIDFLEAQEALKAVIAPLVGADLNSLPAFAGVGASAERLAEYIGRKLAERLGTDGDLLYRLSVTEAPGCEAAFYP